MVSSIIIYIGIMIIGVLINYLLPQSKRQIFNSIYGGLVLLMISYKAFIFVWINIGFYTFLIKILDRQGQYNIKKISVLSIIGSLILLGIYYQFVPFRSIQEGHFYIAIGAIYSLIQSQKVLLAVNKGQIDPHKIFYDLLAVHFYFPKVLLGPVQDPKVLLESFKQTSTWSKERFKEGLLLIMWGLFQKLVISNRIGLMVEHSFNQLSYVQGLALVLASLGLLIQFYIDYCAFIDIGVGFSHMMGIDMAHAFNSPFSRHYERPFAHRYQIGIKDYLIDLYHLFVPESNHKKTKEQVVSKRFLGLRHYSGMMFLLLVLVLLRTGSIQGMHLWFLQLMRFNFIVEWSSWGINVSLSVFNLIRSLLTMFLFWFIHTWHAFYKKDYPLNIYAYTKSSFWKNVEIVTLLLAFIVLADFSNMSFMKWF